MKDKVKYVLNPFTGQFDAVMEVNFDRIITHEYNELGNPLVMFDPVSGLYIEVGAMLVTDNEGNVVTT